MKTATIRKVVFGHPHPLSISERISALMPFVICIRKHLESVRGVSIDVPAFKSLPSHYFKILGTEPFFTAFLRAVLDTISLVEAGDRLTLICDDEEQMALPMYKLYPKPATSYQHFASPTTDFCLDSRQPI